MLESKVSCPECGSYAVTPTTQPPDVWCEYHCDDCGHYFVDVAQAEEQPVQPTRLRASGKKAEGEAMRSVWIEGVRAVRMFDRPSATP